MAVTTPEPTPKPFQKGFTPKTAWTTEQAAQMNVKAVAMRKARSEVKKQQKQDSSTVCRTRLQKGMAAIFGKWDETKLKINSWRDLQIAANIADLAFGWSQDRADRHEHLHVHTVKRLTDESETPQPVVTCGIPDDPPK